MLLFHLPSPNGILHQFASNLVDLFSVYTAPATGNIAVATSYVYNVDRQLTSETRPDGSTLQYSYSPFKAMPSSVVGSLKSISFSWTPSSSVYPGSTSTSDGINLSISAVKDFQLSRNYTSGVVIGRIGYSLNNQHLLGSISVNQVSVATYGYNIDRQLTSAGEMTITRDPLNAAMTSSTLGNVQMSYGYNTFGELTSSDAKYAGTSFLSSAFNRDRLGRVTSKTETVSGATKVYGYNYDSVGRLSSVSINGAVVNQYGYDSNGNRTSLNSVTASYDSQDKLLQYGDTNYTYSPNGHLTQKQKGTDVTKYVYDDFGQLAKVTLPSGQVIDYLIDGQAQRVVKKVDGVIKNKYMYGSNGNIAVELNVDNTVKSIFIYGTQGHSPDYLIQGTVRYRFVKDQLGSIRFVVNSSTGFVAQALEYDEFGKVIQDTNPAFQPFGFAGGLYDSDTKLVRFGARDYDSEIGRWTAKDPIMFKGGDSNLFGYVAGDPVNWVDPSGLARCTYSISTGQLTCSSNDGSQTIGLTGISGSLLGGPLPTGQYDITKSAGQTSGNWFLDPGDLSRALYRTSELTRKNFGFSFWRGGFILHLPGRASNGCISVPTGSNPGTGISELNNLLTNEAGRNTLDVLQ